MDTERATLEDTAAATEGDTATAGTVRALSFKKMKRTC